MNIFAQAKQNVRNLYLETLGDIVCSFKQLNGVLIYLENKEEYRNILSKIGDYTLDALFSKVLLGMNKDLHKITDQVVVDIINTLYDVSKNSINSASHFLEIKKIYDSVGKGLDSARSSSWYPITFEYLYNEVEGFLDEFSSIKHSFSFRPVPKVCQEITIEDNELEKNLGSKTNSSQSSGFVALLGMAKKGDVNLQSFTSPIDQLLTNSTSEILRRVDSNRSDRRSTNFDKKTASTQNHSAARSNLKNVAIVFESEIKSLPSSSEKISIQSETLTIVKGCQCVATNPGTEGLYLSNDVGDIYRVNEDKSNKHSKYKIKKIISTLDLISNLVVGSDGTILYSQLQTGLYRYKVDDHDAKPVYLGKIRNTGNWNRNAVFGSDSSTIFVIESDYEIRCYTITSNKAKSTLLINRCISPSTHIASIQFIPNSSSSFLKIFWSSGSTSTIPPQEPRSEGTYGEVDALYQSNALKHPQPLVMGQDGRFVMLSTSNSNSISIFEKSTYSEICTINKHNDTPRDLAIWGNKAAVAWGRGEVELINCDSS